VVLTDGSLPALIFVALAKAGAQATSVVQVALGTRFRGYDGKADGCQMLETFH
jgi:hypothetical protein